MALRTLDLQFHGTRDGKTLNVLNVIDGDCLVAGAKLA
jgi:hypothetical protein